MNFDNLSKEIEKIDKELSNRKIKLDPNGYFIIKVDLNLKKIVVEHYLNNINQKGIAVDPTTNKPIECKSTNKRNVYKKFIGNSAKEVGILITEKEDNLISKFDHALYLGRELQKAEACLLKNFNYVQD